MLLVTPTLFGWDTDVATDEFVAAVEATFPGSRVVTQPPGREQWTRVEVTLPSHAMIMLTAGRPEIRIEGGTWDLVVEAAVWFRQVVPDSVRLLLSDPGLERSLELPPGIGVPQVHEAWPTS